jgi:hypothetical protein
MKALLLLLLLGACSITDPYQREGVWRPNGANDIDLRVMVANPQDLVRGPEVSGSDGRQAAAAVDRLRRDKVKPLPDSGVADLKAISTGSPVSASE